MQMIKRALIAAALLASGISGAWAEVVFEGSIRHTAVSAQCQNQHVNDKYNSTFHPNTAGNDNFSSLSWVSSHGARGHSLSGALTNIFQDVVTGGVGWGDAFIVPEEEFAQIRLISSTPVIANLTTTTQAVILRGQIRRLFNDPGGLACTVTFIGTFTKDSSQ
jgi:hypothetical protein